jgi:hypothetical protein
MQLFNGLLNTREKGVYQNDLVDANADYLEVDKSMVWNKVSDIDFEIDITFDYTSNNSFISKGAFTNVTTGLFYMYKISSTQLAIVLSDINNVDFNSYFPLLNDGSYTITLKNRELKVDGNLLFTIPEQDINLINDGTFPATIGKLSYQNSFYFNGGVKSFSLNGETFSLNEASGATFYGDAGTTGTRNTSAASPLDYINQTMIQRYG